MSEQLIISVSREYGSGGHAIAEQLAKRFDLPFYDRNLLEEIAKEKGLDVKNIKKYDETSKKPLLSRTVRGYSSSPEENIAKMQFDHLKDMAKEGKSFVIVGRCSETILKENPALVSVFILGDMDKRIERIMEVRGMSEAEAEDAVRRHDKSRKAYHNHYSERKWGDSRNYDITINSSKLGIERTAEVLADYIEERRKFL